MAKQQQTKQKRIPLRSTEYNEFGFPRSVEIKGTTCYFQFLAPITRDGVYKGTNAQGTDIHGLHTNPLARDNQAAYFLRGS